VDTLHKRIHPAIKKDKTVIAHLTAIYASNSIRTRRIGGRKEGSTKHFHLHLYTVDGNWGLSCNPEGRSQVKERLVESHAETLRK